MDYSLLCCGRARGVAWSRCCGVVKALRQKGNQQFFLKKKSSRTPPKSCCCCCCVCCCSCCCLLLFCLLLCGSSSSLRCWLCQVYRQCSGCCVVYKHDMSRLLRLQKRHLRSHINYPQGIVLHYGFKINAKTTTARNIFRKCVRIKLIHHVKSVIVFAAMAVGQGSNSKRSASFFFSASLRRLENTRLPNSHTIFCELIHRQSHVARGN